MDNARELISSLVKRRREAWETKGSISLDKRICMENADIILDTPHLRDKYTCPMSLATGSL